MKTQPPPLRPHAQGWVVAALALAWLSASAWARPLMLPDEGRYVGVAWEMLRSGDWLTPALNGLPYFHKPPLFYWLTAAAMSLLGPHEWAGRAAPVLAAWCGALSIHRFALRWASPRLALSCVVVLLANPLYFVGAQFANLDMLVSGCITVAIVAFAHAALAIEAGQSHRAALACGFAAAALGVLAKGLIGVVIPVLVVVAWLASSRRWQTLVALVWWPGIALFASIVAPWFVWMTVRHDGFLDYFFVVQHVKRFAAGGFNNVQPFWFYPAVLALVSLPWWPWLWRSVRRGSTGDAPTASVRSLMVWWIVVVVVFFSLPRSKLVGYVLPAMAPLAFLIADGFSSLATPSRGQRRGWLAGLAAGAALSLVAVAFLALRPTHSTKELSAALKAVREAGQPVVMLEDYYFDLPFYAALDGPVTVVDDWTPTAVDLHDDWRKELADAGRFAPAHASRALIAPERLVERLCSAPVSWVVAARDSGQRLAFLQPLRPIAERRGTALWRVEHARPGTASALRCAETPNGVPADR